MFKYFFLFAIGLFLLSTNNTFAAQTTEKNQAQIKTQLEGGLNVAIDQFSENISASQINDWIANDNVFSLSTERKSEFENTNYCPVNKVFCLLTITNTKRSRIVLSPQTILDTRSITKYVEDLSKKVNRQPEDAKFKIEDGKVVTFMEPQDGIVLNVSNSVELISQVLQKEAIERPATLSLPYEKKGATSGYADINNLGISSLIGEGTSNFKGSPINRVKNIKVAVSRFNGILIKPGEEFSFVKNLGDVDEQHGYFPELVIKKGITEPEFGGGVCQVSSTVFRAAIYSGLKITARRNHAYPVSYYSPHGMDSTVYVPNPDLKFINNTPNHILIQAKIEDTQLTFYFYGTNDGRKTTVDGPYITEKQPDGALKAQFTQVVTDRDGKELINDTFKSAYASPHKYPHPGGPVLSAKPSNWSEEEWKNYKKTIKDMAKAAVKP